MSIRSYDSETLQKLGIYPGMPFTLWYTIIPNSPSGSPSITTPVNEHWYGNPNDAYYDAEDLLEEDDTLPTIVVKNKYFRTVAVIFGK